MGRPYSFLPADGCVGGYTRYPGKTDVAVPLRWGKKPSRSHAAVEEAIGGKRRKSEKKSLRARESREGGKKRGGGGCRKDFS